MHPTANQKLAVTPNGLTACQRKEASKPLEREVLRDFRLGATSARLAGAAAKMFEDPVLDKGAHTDPLELTELFYAIIYFAPYRNGAPSLRICHRTSPELTHCMLYKCVSVQLELE